MFFVPSHPKAFLCDLVVELTRAGNEEACPTRIRIRTRTQEYADTRIRMRIKTHEYAETRTSTITHRSLINT